MRGKKEGFLLKLCGGAPVGMGGIDWSTAIGPATWSQWTLAGCAVLAAIIGWLTLRSIKRQAEITERTITHLERPWLMVKPGLPEKWPTDYKIRFPFSPTFTSNVSNVGRSPAFLVQQHINNVVVVPIPKVTDQPQYAADPTPFAELIIEPNGEVHSQRAGKPISESEFTSILHGQQCIMFYGFVRYHDVLRTVEHQTRFCAYWTKRPSEIGTDRWEFHPIGPPAYIEYT